ncbi:MAG: PAS domain-containing protein [Rhodobacter sp.]|nr:PAS domain-containing protein [Rhodobacter sp.]
MTITMEMTHGFASNVVPFARKSQAMIFPAITQVDAYWEGLRNGRLMPDRSEVDPRGMENALEFAFMLECVAPGVARVRIAGMHLNDLLGMEVRGMPLTALFEPAARERVAEVLARITNTPHVADLRLSSGRGVGRALLTAQMYLAPLSNQGQDTGRMLGCLQSDGRIGRTPRRFGLDQVQMRRIVSSSGKATGPGDTPAPHAARPELAENAATFGPAPEPPARHLRLVKGKGETA